MKYGIELEFFVENKENVIVPAYTVTDNTDGNPIIGEIKTSVHNNIVDCVFELKKLLYLETQKIESKDCEIILKNSIDVSADFLQKVREDEQFVDQKNFEVLKELSIYPNKKFITDLKRGHFTASLQINFSEEKSFDYDVYTKVTIEDKFKYDIETKKKSYSNLFDYVDIIQKLDTVFMEDIKNSKRKKGIYAIKEGIGGDRIEYRSLPNTVDLDKIINTLLEANK